jgi:prepilin-type N-terminal cleavage/methylation domain-containing protein
MHAAPLSYRDRRADRRAFTLLEVLVALVILGVGVVGLAGNAALVSRLVGDGTRLTLVAAVATARFEQLRALPCASAAPGNAITHGIEERWTVAPLGGAGPSSALEIQLALTYPVRAGAPRTQPFRGAVPCH